MKINLKSLPSALLSSLAASISPEKARRITRATALAPETIESLLSDLQALNAQGKAGEKEGRKIRRTLRKAGVRVSELKGWQEVKDRNRAEVLAALAASSQEEEVAETEEAQGEAQDAVEGEDEGKD